MTKQKWKKFEELAAKIQAELAPNSPILTNKKIMGKISRTKREVDILIPGNVAGYNIIIAISCKDHKKPVDVNLMASEKALFEDIGAHIKIIVSASGFTESAINIAKQADIKVYKLIDTGKHDWQSTINITLPSLCTVKNLSSLQHIKYLGGRLPVDHSLTLYDKDKNKLGEINELILDWWTLNSDSFPEGESKSIEFIKHPVYLLVKHDLYPIEIELSIVVEEIRYFHNWPIREISGFENQIDKKIETRGFTLSEFSINELKTNWTRLNRNEPPPKSPVITFSIDTIAQL